MRFCFVSSVAEPHAHAARGSTRVGSCADAPLRRGAWLERGARVRARASRRSVDSSQQPAIHNNFRSFVILLAACPPSPNKNRLPCVQNDVTPAWSLRASRQNRVREMTSRLPLPNRYNVKTITITNRWTVCSRHSVNSQNDVTPARPLRA